jgi:hypothetical protein
VSRSYSLSHIFINGLRRCVRWGFRQFHPYSYEVYPTNIRRPMHFFLLQRLKLVNRTHYPYNDVRRPPPQIARRLSPIESRRYERKSTRYGILLLWYGEIRISSRE